VRVGAGPQLWLLVFPLGAFGVEASSGDPADALDAPSNDLDDHPAEG